MGNYPQYHGRVIHALDGVWDFHFVDGGVKRPASPALAKVRYDDRQAVPGVFDALPRHAGKRGTAFDRTRVTVTPRANLLLKSPGLGMWGAFFWDGRRVGVHDLPYSGLEFRFNAGEGAEHELVAVIDNRFDAERQPLLSPFFDFYCHGGIFRPLELHEVPPVSLDRAFVHVTDLKAGRVDVEVLLAGDELPERITLAAAFDGGERKSRTLKVRDGRAKFSAVLDDKRKWDCEHPVLHTLSVSLGEETLTERFGLRTVEAKKGKILLNGKPIRLYGCCRHEAHPEFGPALPMQIIIEDVQLLRQVGCNFVRGSHYPQDQRFLDLCDEFGILVWEEALGWGNKPEQYADPRFASAQLRQLAPMVKNSGNHPAVILWGFMNEGSSEDPECRSLYKDMTAELRRLDPSRLVTYATKKFTNDIDLDLVDVVGLNTYPGWYAADQEKYRPLDEIAVKCDTFLDFLHERGFDDKPLIVSEIGAGAIYGWRDRLNGQWSEEYQRDYLNTVLDYFFGHDRISGISLWQFIDCRTYSSARAIRRPRAFNNKGIFDEYRRPKLAAETVTRRFRAARRLDTEQTDANGHDMP